MSESDGGQCPPGPYDEPGVELDLEHRRYLVETHARLATITHYELLGVRPDADKKAIKSAYFRIASSVHPDRHFKKQLGSFKARMEAIFIRVEEAYRTLTSSESRAAYDARLASAPPSSRAPWGNEGSPRPLPIDPRLAQKRAAALDALKQQVQGARARAKTYAEQGAKARAAGDVTAAADFYRQALTFAPDDASLREALAAIEAESGEKLVESYARKAALEERFQRWAAAAESWDKVVRARPDDAEARARLANALAKSGK